MKKKKKSLKYIEKEISTRVRVKTVPIVRQNFSAFHVWISSMWIDLCMNESRMNESREDEPYACKPHVKTYCVIRTSMGVLGCMPVSLGMLSQSRSMFSLCLFIRGSRERFNLYKRSFIGSRQAYSCNKLDLMYFGSFRLARIAQFWMRWSRSNWVVVAEIRAALPYSKIGRTYTL